jgi:preprotein translocase subunit SecF
VLAFYLGVAVLSVLVIFFQMPRRMMPYVESPLVAVVSMMPGLSAEEMEIYFSKPIEERMVDLKNVHFVRSTSQEGFSIVTIEFWYGTDMKKSLFDVQALMNVVQADLPMTGANLKPSWVLAIDPLNIPVLSLAVTGEVYDRVQLRTLVENEVVNRLKTVKDVYSVVPFGGQKLQMQVIADRERLAAYRMSLLDLRTMLDMQNQARPAGTLTHGDRELIVRSDFRARTPEEVASYPIGSMDGRTAYLRDVAEVTNAPREQRSLYRFNGQEAVEISIVQQPDASSVTVIADVKAKLAEIQQDYPGLRFAVAYDNSTFVGYLMKNMVEELVIAVLLTGLVVLFFLGSIRGTLVSLITIPITLGMTLLAMVPLGMTLNSSTLIGLLLSIGRLVDDSIIDIHSIERHLRMGKSPKDAAIDGINAVRLAVLAITFMLCMALLPLAFSGGIVQFMFEGIVWAIILALLSSAVVSFTLTALLAATLFTPHTDEARSRGWLNRWLLDPSQRALDRLEARYRQSLAWSLRNRLAGDGGGGGDHAGRARALPEDRQRDDAARRRLAGVRAARGHPGHVICPDVGDRGRDRAAAAEAAGDREGVVRGRLRARRHLLHGLQHGVGQLRVHDDHARRFVEAVAQHLARHGRRAGRGARHDPRHPPAHDQGDGRRRHGVERGPRAGGLLRPRPRHAGRNRRAGAPARPGHPRLPAGRDVVVDDAAPAARAGQPRARPGAGPHRLRGRRPGLLRAEGRSHERVLPPRQQAPVHDPPALPRRPAAGPGGPRAGQGGGQEG